MIESDVAVVVPVHNEERVLSSVLDELTTYFDNIICVDDGSLDRSKDILNSRAVTSIHLSQNIGQGGAIKAGVAYALSQGANYILTFDSDGQHIVKDAVNMVEHIKNDDVDIVLGNRFYQGARNNSIPRLRKVILKLAVYVFNLFSKVRLNDAHNGLRCFNRKFAQELTIVDYRMGHASDIMKMIRSLKYKYKEIPVDIVYTEYSLSKGQKSINAVNILTDRIIGLFR